MAELPMLFFVLAGYLAFLSGVRGKGWAVAAATFLWALALVTKLQVLPFWLASLAACAAYAARLRHWRLALVSLGTILVSVGLARLLMAFWGSEPPVQGLYGVWPLSHW